MRCARPLASSPQRASCSFLTRGCSRVTPHCVNSLMILHSAGARWAVLTHTYERDARERRVRCLTPIVSAEGRGQTKHHKRARRAPAGRSPTSVRSGQCQNNTPTHTVAGGCQCHVSRAPRGAHTPGKGRHTPHRHARAQRRAPLSDCDTVSVRDISTISQILVADAAGA